MADNPVSWLLLMLIGLFFIVRFLLALIREAEAIKAEREKACQEIFLESPIDKRNISVYNRSINKEDKHL